MNNKLKSTNKKFSLSASTNAINDLNLNSLFNSGQNIIFRRLSLKSTKLGNKFRSNSFQPKTKNSTKYDKSIENNFNVSKKELDNSYIEETKPAKKFQKPSSKPPSILIYTGNDRLELYQKLVKLLNQLLPSNTYTINHLSIKALKFYPWNHENSACLIILNTENLDDIAWARLHEHFINSGKMLFVCQNVLLTDLLESDSIKKRINLLKNVFDKKLNGFNVFDKSFETFLKKSLKILIKEKQVNETFHAKDPVGGYKFSVVLFKKNNQPLLLYMQNSENHKIRNCALFSDASADELLDSKELVSDALTRLGIDINILPNNIPSLSYGYMLCQKDRLILDVKGLSYLRLLGDSVLKPKLLFQHYSQRNNEDEESLPNTSNEILSVFVCKKKEVAPELAENIDYFSYFNFLKTKSLGKVLLYVPVCNTTIDIANSLTNAFPQVDGILIMAGCQLNGRGRSNNVWLSPKGCLIFTFNFNVPVSSTLGQSITFIQHILAVSIVDAILESANDQEFPIQIKWPNDIYYKRDFKLGGILVTASHKVTRYECFVSSGINISNIKPTVSINNFLPANKPLLIEKVQAEILNKFEHYINIFVKEGKDVFLKQYYKYWMHDNEEVSVLNNEIDTKEKVIIRGLDENGYLKVEGKLDGRIFSVQDNGNTFDLMQGLIYSKT